MGVGLAVAVLLDATLVRAVLLPAAMKLLGERNWYLPSGCAGCRGSHEACPSPPTRTSRHRSPSDTGLAFASAAYANRRAHRGRRLPRPQCGHPRPSSARASTPTGTSSSGFRYGWAGVLNNEAVDLTLDTHARHPAPRRHDPRLVPHEPVQGRGRRRTRCTAAMRARGLDALIPIGGEDTLGVAGKLHEDGIPVVGVPKTIDNDLGGDRLHVRLPDRGADRHRRDRPPAHHRRVPQPRDHRARSWAATPAGSPSTPAWPAAPT